MKKILLQLVVIFLFLVQSFNGIGQITPGSLLASSNDNLVLSNWLGGNLSGTLLYRRSLNGSSSTTFHSLCDNQGPTITLIKTVNNTVFGGYNPNSWNSSNQYLAGASAFLFNLTTAQKAATSSTYYGASNPYSTYNSADRVAFGGGHDLYINSTMNGGSINTGYSYITLNGTATASVAAANALAGPGFTTIQMPANFITEIEVYKISTGPAVSPPATALNFDGSNDFVAVNNPFRAYNKEITVEFWMYTPNAKMPSGSLMGQGTSNVDNWGGHNVWLMHPNDDASGTMTFYVNDAGNPRYVTFNIIAGGWHHYAAVSNSTSTKVYVDGVLKQTGSGISGTIVNNTNSVVHIGKDVRFSSEPRFGNFSIDEVRIWNRALCQDEINNNKNAEINPTGQNGLQEYYRFNQGFVDANNTSVTGLTDLSGNNRSGLLNNFALNGATSNWSASGSTNTGIVNAFAPSTINISGNTSICAGTSSTLSSTTTGGKWTSSNPAVASVNLNTGVVTAVSAGTTTITYSTECSSGSVNFTVKAVPNSTITATGATNICPGTSITLNAVAAAGNTYQWFNNGNSINGANGATYNAANSGAYTVQVTNNGCTSTTSAPITINAVDATPPVFTGTATITTILNPQGNLYATSQNGAIVNYVLPTATDNCSGVITVTATPASGSVFPIGTTTVTVVATDAAGNTATSSFTVTVTGIAPVIGTPANISVSNAPGVCGANVSYAATETTVGIPASTITYSIASGSLFAVGTTTVTVTATNAVGSSSKTFTVTVNDTEKPTITAPVNISLNASSSCNANVTVPIPAVSDNCSGSASNVLNFDGQNDYVSVPHNPAFASINYAAEAWIYTTGGAEYKWVFGKRVCGSNGWNLYVHNNQLELWNGCYAIYAGPSIPFNTWVHVAVTGSGSGQKVYLNGVQVVSTSAVVVPSDASTNFTIGVNNDGNSPWNFGGSMYNVRFWNKTLTQTEIQSNMSNTVAPQAGLVVNFSCNQGVANGNNSSISQLIDASGNGFNGVLNNFNKNSSNSNFVTGPSASSITLTNSFNGTSNASGTYPLGVTNITWTATDAAGNTSTASQAVTVVDATAPTINTVANINTIATSAAGAVVNYSAPVGTDNCSGSTTTQTAGLPSGSTFQLGTTTNTFVVTDAAGNTATSSFTVTVVGVPPVIVVSTNITVNNDASNCGAIVNFTATETTAIPASTITYSHAPGSVFPVGTTLVTATATNAIGSSSATFTVTVNDTEKPVVITRPVSVTLVNGAANVTAAQVNNGSTDNCGIQSVVLSGKTNYTCADLGTHTVTLTVKDIHGNVQTATAVVTVVGQLPTSSIVSQPTSSVYTGGNANNIYLGYGAQSTVLKVNATGGSAYTYQWMGAATNMLSSTTSGMPVFTPTVAGTYTFTVVVTNNFGCTTTSKITICVKDIRVPGSKGAGKVYLCHMPPGNNQNPQTLEISVNAVAAHLTGHSGDRLGSCATAACVESTPTVGATNTNNFSKAEEVVADDLKVTVMPNPSTTYFTLKLVSQSNLPVNIKVVDAAGRLVDAKAKQAANSTLQLGHNYATGNYFAEFIQGNQRKVVQLIKIK